MNLSDFTDDNMRACEPLKPLVYLFDTDEVISEYESEYRQGEKQFLNYKQLNDKTSLDWFCSDELIKLYEKWDCKNSPEAKMARAYISTAKTALKALGGILH